MLERRREGVDAVRGKADFTSAATGCATARYRTISRRFLAEPDMTVVLVRFAAIVQRVDRGIQ